MSLKDAHAATSISTNTLRSIEDGSTKPTLDEFFALAKTYRCSGDCILASAIRLSCSIDEIVDMGKHMISAN